METEGKKRRSFIGRLTAISAAAGGLAMGLVPELRAQVRPAQLLGVTPALPPGTPLPPTQQNQMYSAALNDADVSLLLTALGEAGRLDPPNQSLDLALDAGNRAQSIVIPVTSYATGAVIAFVYYGSADMHASDGTDSSLRLCTLVSNTGAVKLAGGGRMGDSPKPEWNDALFAQLFPTEYYNARISIDTGATQTLRASTGVGSMIRTAWNGLDRRNFRKMRNVDNSKRGACLRDCTAAWQQCLNSAFAPAAAGVLVGIWCIACLALASGVIVVTAGAGAPTLYACITPCAIGTAALIAAEAVMLNCASLASKCQAKCMLIPPNVPL